MRISSSQADHRNILIAFNGELIGHVQCADTETGELIRIDPETGQVQNLSGHVAIIGESIEDPPELRHQRYDAIRGYLRSRALLDNDVVTANKLLPIDQKAYELECLARRAREGVVVIKQETFTKEHDYLPMPEGRQKVIPTGKLTFLVEYEAPDLVKAYEDAKTIWARENPELVAEYVRGKTEGPPK